MAALVAVISAALATVTTVIVQRKPAAVTAEAQAQTAVNDGFAKLSTKLMERMGEQDELILQLRGEIENLSQHVYSLENALRKEGLPIPIRVRPQVFAVVEGGKPS